MKRPLIFMAVALIIGILAADITGSYFFIGICAVVFTGISLVAVRKISSFLRVCGVIVIFFLVGALEFVVVDNLNTNKFTAFSGQQVLIKGFICAEPDIREFKILYTIKTDSLSFSGSSEKIHGKILMTTLRNSETANLEYGDEVEVKGQLNLPKGKRTPSGFNYQRYLAKSGISATLFANRENIIVNEKENGNDIVNLGLTIRKRIINVINTSMGSEQAGLLNGMLIGYTKGLDKNTINAFSDSGLSHLMAVSGMNVAFIVFPLIFIFKKLRMKLALSNMLIIAILLLFVFVTGFSPSVVRAVIMAIIILVGQILKREADIYTSLSFAAMVLLLYNPYNLFDIGFQLSFAATLSLVLFYKTIKKYIGFKWMPNLIADVLSATLAAQIGVLPITAYYFNKISIISLVSNLVVVPLVEIISTVGYVMAILGQVHPFFSIILGYFNSTLLTFILYVTKLSASIPFAVIRVVTPSILVIMIYYFLIVFFLWYRPRYHTKIKPIILGIICVIVLLPFITGIFVPKDLKVVFLDVGQGDAAFIRTSEGKTVLIDGGGLSSKIDKTSNSGDNVIIPFLLDFGVQRLDLVIATHGHDDHLLGLKPIIKEVDVGNLVIPEMEDYKVFGELLHMADNRKVKVKACKEGDIIHLDKKTQIRVIYPKKDILADEAALNNSSLVLKLIYENNSILFTGDIESEVESMLLSSNADIKANVLKIAHHGSISSSTESFIKEVGAKAAVISVGKNTFGHPSGKVLERLNDNSTLIFRTDQDGSIILSSDGNHIKFEKTVGD